MASVFPDTSVNNPATGAAWNDGDFWKDPNTSITYVWEDPVWKGYSEGVTPLGDYVQIIGDNMTGDLTLSTDKVVLDATGGSITAASYIKSTNHSEGQSYIAAENKGINYGFLAADGEDVLAGIAMDGSASFKGPISPGDADSGIALVNVGGETGACLLSTNKTDITSSRTGNIGSAGQPWNKAYFAGDVKIKNTTLKEASFNFSIGIEAGNNDIQFQSGGATFASFKGLDGSLELDGSITADGGGTFNSSVVVSNSGSGTYTNNDGGGLYGYNGSTENYRILATTGDATFTGKVKAGSFDLESLPALS